MQAMYNGRIDKRVLSIKKGMELQVNISTDISAPDSVMYQTYCQTLQALFGIVKQTKKFYDTCEREAVSEEQLDEYLFPFSSNIIAFSGSRGIGKTRTMLSFSGFLQKGKQERSRALDQMDRGSMKMLASKDFTVLPPISPSVLEEKQNILYVILTRLYRFADERLREEESRKNRNFSQRREKLSKAFQDCYSGINGLKIQNQKKYGDLMELQDLRDGLILRRHFFKLITTILNPSKREDAFLVLQLDDADSQVENGYEVLEDVRKYLQIPNLVILMSTDIEMLQNVILQDYFCQFSDRKNDETFKKELMKSCRKYIDKLIPPSYMIHLPTLHQLLEYYSNIELDYTEGDEENGKQIYPWAKGMDVQDTILMEIYRKTGVLFVRPKNYVHYIVPTTIRGLNQLLYMLSRMDKLPMLGSSRENFESSENLVEALSKRIKLEDENLRLFSDYFTEGWVKVKVVQEKDQHFLKTLSEESSRMYVQTTIEYLYERYRGSPVLSDRKKHFTQPFLDRLMVDLGEEHAGQEDSYLLFSIRTIFTLNHHKMVLRQKRDAVRRFYQMKESNSNEMMGYFAVDYDPEVTFLPRTYLVNERIRKLELGSSRTLEEQRKRYEDCLEKLEKTAKLVLRAENQLSKRTEELNEAKKQTQDLERAIRELTRAVTEAERNAQSRQNAAENAALEVKFLQVELAAQREQKDTVLLTQKIGKATLSQEDAERRAERAREQVHAVNEQVRKAKEQHRTLVRQLPEMKDREDRAKLALEAKKEELAKTEELCQNEKALLHKIVQALAPKQEREQEYAMVHPVFQAPEVLAELFDELLTVESNDTLHGIDAMKRLFCACMVNGCADEAGLEVNFMNFLTFLLRLGHPGVIGAQNRDVDSVIFQYKLYVIQECVLLVACNWDVQDALYKSIAWVLRDPEQNTSFNQLYQAVDDVLTRSINGGKIYAYHMECCEAQWKETICAENGWGIQQGYSLFDAGSKYTLLPYIDREKLMKYVIFDLVEPEVETVSEEPLEYLGNPKPDFGV